MNKLRNYSTIAFYILIILLSSCKNETNKNSLSVHDTVVITEDIIVLNDSIVEEKPIIYTDTAEIIQQEEEFGLDGIVIYWWQMYVDGDSCSDVKLFICNDKKNGISLDSIIYTLDLFYHVDTIKKYWNECK